VRCASCRQLGVYSFFTNSHTRALTQTNPSSGTEGDGDDELARALALSMEDEAAEGGAGGGGASGGGADGGTGGGSGGGSGGGGAPPPPPAPSSGS
jgi:hypothetical protein